ncbi:MAG: 4Fe-4S binding protein [Peptococcaceae bacterium]|nr:4Fe-4S binding protein [Peptococcaceae bacterium]
MKRNRLTRFLRWGILAVITVFVTIESYLHVVNGGGSNPSIHALCPFGGLESLYKLMAEGSFVGKIFSGTFILFVITFVIAIIFKRSFCGLLCPFGAIQEFFAGLGRKVFKRKFIIPLSVDRPLRYLKYIVLLVTVAYAWKTAGLWMAPYDPWSAYGHLSEGLASVWEESSIGLILLIVTLVGSLLYDRFFCKYLCPAGAFYGIVGRISPFRVVRDESKCINCRLCSRECPVNIDVQQLKEVKSPECIDCQICVLACPKEGALMLKEGKIALTAPIVILTVVLLFFGSILLTKELGIFQVIPAQPESGETITYEEVKGYMSIKEAADFTKTELKEFYIKFEIPASVPEGTKMKEIGSSVPGYDFDEIKAKNSDQS